MPYVGHGIALTTPFSARAVHRRLHLIRFRSIYYRMTDQDFLTAFASRRLDPASFHHRDHLRLAWLLLGRHRREEAERRLLEGLRALAEQAGKAERFNAGLTLAWVDLIATAREA